MGLIILLLQIEFQSYVVEVQALRGINVFDIAANQELLAHLQLTEIGHCKVDISFNATDA